MRKRDANFAVPNGQGHRANPAVERLAQLVDTELLDAEQNDRVGPVGHVTLPHRPTRHLGRTTRITAPGEHPERPLHHGMGQVHEQCVASRLEHA